MRRHTKQRSAVLDILQQTPDFHSAQQIYVMLKERGTSIGLATVYRNLDTLAEMGKVDSIRSEEGEALYRACDEDSHHHHLVCRSCGKTEEIDSEPLEQWVDSISKRHHFTSINHSGDLFGTCEDCTDA